MILAHYWDQMRDTLVARIRLSDGDLEVASNGTVLVICRTAAMKNRLSIREVRPFSSIKTPYEDFGTVSTVELMKRDRGIVRVTIDSGDGETKTVQITSNAEHGEVDLAATIAGGS